jgi:hypothetical protein
MQEIHEPKHVGVLGPHLIEDWQPEDTGFWASTGRRIARRNLFISIPALLLSFAVWMVWSVVVAKLPSVGFTYTTDQLFWLAALPGLSGAMLRIFYSFMVPIFGGRLWTTLTTWSLIVPALGIGMAVQNPATPYWIFLALALLCGFGGGNFASSMANISFFFPKAEKGNALALNAGLGNLGVSVVQFAVPLVITTGVFGWLGGVAGVLFFLNAGSWTGFFAMFLFLFLVSGIGNASTFQMSPAIMRSETDRLLPNAGDAVPPGESTVDALEEGKTVEKVAHLLSRSFGWLRSRCAGGRRWPAAAFDVAQQSAAPRVEPPGDGNAGEVEHQEGPERGLCAARQADRGPVALRNEKGAIGRDRGGKADDGCALLVGLSHARCGITSRRDQPAGRDAIRLSHHPSDPPHSRRTAAVLRRAGKDRMLPCRAFASDRAGAVHRPPCSARGAGRGRAAFAEHLPSALRSQGPRGPRQLRPPPSCARGSVFPNLPHPEPRSPRHRAARIPGLLMRRSLIGIDVTPFGHGPLPLRMTSIAISPCLI